MSSRSTPDKPARSAGKPAPDATRVDGNDVAVVCGVSDDGQGLNVLRKRGDRVEAGTVRKLEEGKPILGELVRLRPREAQPMVCDVQVEMPAAVRGGNRPAQVATDSYRKNWDAIYSKSRRSRPVGSGRGRKPLLN